MTVQTPRVDEHTQTLRAENDALRKVVYALHDAMEEAMQLLQPPVRRGDVERARDRLAVVHYQREDTW